MGAHEHQAHRRGAGFLAGYRDGTAVQKIRHRRIVQSQLIDPHVGLVRFQILQQRSNDRSRRQEGRVEFRKLLVDAALQVGACANEIEIVGGALLPPAQDADKHPRIV